MYYNAKCDFNKIIEGILFSFTQIQVIKIVLLANWILELRLYLQHRDNYDRT